MALTYCPECSNEISDKAITCPHCGFQLKRKRRFIFIVIPALAVLVAAAIIAAAWLGKKPDSILGVWRLETIQTGDTKISAEEVNGEDDMLFIAEEDHSFMAISPRDTPSLGKWVKNGNGDSYTLFESDGKSELSQLTVNGDIMTIVYAEEDMTVEFTLRIFNPN